MNQNLSVMIVEDEELLLEAISKKLTISEIQAISCGSGEDALKKLEGMETLPDAIWLDYHLQGMDGMAFVSKLKENKLWAEIPVIVVSNSISNEKVYTMLALGVKKYLLKAEHRLEEIVETVKEIVEDRRKEREEK